jgi:hypothetical protein
VDFAFEVMATEKANVDRLCMLGLSKNDRIEELVGDHVEIVKVIQKLDSEGAVAAGMKLLGRLDAIIESIAGLKSGYFEP